MNFRLIVFSALLLVCPAVAQPQTGLTVTLCQLREGAQQFDHKVIHVHGAISLEFEDFTLQDPKCADSASAPVWLTFGGDVSDIAIYCCGNHSRSPGHDLEIDGRPVPLLKDFSYANFYNLIRASRNRRPDGEICSVGCNFYHVSATLTGLFFARADSGGYGHLGCCNLLVIQQVSNVAAERTAVPTGTFDCVKSEWKPMDKEEWGVWTLCNSECDQKTESIVLRAAAHWNDIIVPSNGRTDEFAVSGDNPRDNLIWVSDDMLTKYTVVQERTNAPEVSVTREACQRVSTRTTDSQKISCNEYETAVDWPPDRQQGYERLINQEKYADAEKMIVVSAEKLSSQGDQSWRMLDRAGAAYELLVREAKRWEISIGPELQAEKCSEPESLDEQRYAYNTCSWYSRDGMQEFSVNMMVRKSDGGINRLSPLLLNSVHGRVCHFDGDSLSTADRR